MSFAKVFLEEKMNKAIEKNPENLGDFNCSYQFEVGDGIWNLDLKTKPYRIQIGPLKKPDCVISMTDENFEKMIKGKLNVPLSLVTGKIKISGSKMLALRLQELLKA